MRVSSLKPTKVFDTFWRFVVERQNLFFRRMEYPSAPNWTNDPILANHRFTNVYRAADRVSQYLIRNVICVGDDEPEEMFFRIILFKLFNKIDTWELLKAQIGELTWRHYDFKKYDSILSQAMSNKAAIYSAAYIMASGRTAFGHERKHRNHLRLLEKMMGERLPNRIKQAQSMSSVFELLKSQPAIGDFLAYQYAIDLNYSTLTDFSENEFVMPGPGALRGIEKCFCGARSVSPAEVIHYVTDQQDQLLDERGLSFRNLWGRPLHLIDVQNVFCEVDKYARVYHPEITCSDGRRRIKQVFRPNRTPISYRFPQKWGINHRVPRETEVGYESLF